MLPWFGVKFSSKHGIAFREVCGGDSEMFGYVNKLSDCLPNGVYVGLSNCLIQCYDWDCFPPEGPRLQVL